MCTRVCMREGNEGGLREEAQLIPLRLFTANPWPTQRLFPESFAASFAFPSFDVYDLDSVDHGIMSRIDSALPRAAGDVTIVHFLGVDHCGHRYGPNHPAMKKKLQEMDHALEAILQKSQAPVLILGDHGMTADVGSRRPFSQHGQLPERERGEGKSTGAQSHLVIMPPLIYTPG